MLGYHPSDDGTKEPSLNGGASSITASVMHEESVPLTVSTTPQVNGYGSSGADDGSIGGANGVGSPKKPKLRAGALRSGSKKPAKKTDRMSSFNIEGPDESFDPEDPNADPFEYAAGGDKYNWHFPPVLCPCAKRVGNMSVICECTSRDTGEPTICCVAGPYWPFMVFCTFPTILFVSIVVGVTSLHHASRGVSVCYWILTAFTLCGLLRVGLTDPGLFRRVRRKPDDEDRDIEEQYIWSQQGQSWRPPTALYSRDCNVIISNFDHTCPWTGTAIGSGNMPAFDCFTKSLCALACFDICLVMFNAIVSGGTGVP